MKSLSGTRNIRSDTCSARKMSGRWLPFVDAEPHVDKSSLIISPSKIRDKNGASDMLASAGTSKSRKERRHCAEKYGWNGSTLWIFFLHSFLVICTAGEPADTEQCAIGLKTAGRTWPRGDIVLEHGQPLRIYCILNDNLSNPKYRGRNASDLVFFRKDTVVGPEYITVVNETTALMHIDQPAPSTDMYFCKLRLNDSPTDLQKYHAVCLNLVQIGFKPKEPPNFSCISYNWEKLVCTWEPVPNDIKTQYSLAFKYPGQAGKRVYHCPEIPRESELPQDTCVLDISTSPSYRQAQPFWTFILSVKNVLGHEHFTYDFDHFAHVIPSKPVDLSALNKTSSNVLLNWKLPWPMAAFPSNLDQRVSYQSQWDRQKPWQTIDIRNVRPTEEQYFNMTDLHANTVYDVRVFLKSTKSIGDDKWSQSSNITFKTPAARPSLPPKTDVGSFLIVENRDPRDVVIYWQNIPKYLENGDNFTYRAVCVEENGRRLATMTTETYAIFERISSNSLTFEIKAFNSEGASEAKAIVHVPNKLETPQKPVVFTKIAFDGGVYELSWNPLTNSEITNYTIFWSEAHKSYHPSQLSGLLDWVNVPGNTSMYNVTVPDSKKHYQFAISLNTPHASSGMVLFPDLTYSSRVEGKMKSVLFYNLHTDSVDIIWGQLDPDFKRRHVIDGFRIHYCPIVSPDNLICKGPRMTRNFMRAPFTTYGSLYRLDSSSNYMAIVAVLSRNVEIAHTDPFHFTTLEAVPEEAVTELQSASTPPPTPTVTDVLAIIERKFSELDNFIRETKLHDETIDRRLDAIESKLTEYGVKLDLLLEENCQHRENE